MPEAPAATPAARPLDGGTYELLRDRLAAAGADLSERLDRADAVRRDAFGALSTALVATERIQTENNAIPRGMLPLGDTFLFGFNVQLHLRSETRVEDVFGAYRRVGEDELRPRRVDEILGDESFQRDFRDLYRYYKETRFLKFSLRGRYCYMQFQVGRAATDSKAFKWLREDDGRLVYIDNRSEHEVHPPSQHEFEWKRATRDMHRQGRHPHISIEDRLFVETIGGDLTIKVEDNTESGEGIYAEPVREADQTLDDAEIHYAAVGGLILLRVRPYQEDDYRYFVYSEKARVVRRLDAIATACVQLPDDHGLIFPRGYFLQSGECKEFDLDTGGMLFRRRIPSPNGEDTLYVFHHPERGEYALLAYNLIAHKVDTPWLNNGFSLFPDGALYCLKAAEQPQKVHAVQRWRTPFLSPEYEARRRDEEIAREAADENANPAVRAMRRVGNRDVVRALAAGRSLVDLARREDSYDGLYVDLARQADDFLDAFFWAGEEEAGRLDQPVRTLADTARAAIAEFDKVRRLRAHAAEIVGALAARVDEAESARRRDAGDDIARHVDELAALRQLRGEIIAAREVRYADPERLAELEARAVARADQAAAACVDFLQSPAALEPYAARIDEIARAREECAKAADAKELEERADECAAALELLLDTIGSLRIDDVTRRTAILDGVSDVYAALGRTRNAVRQKRRELARQEGSAQFAAEMKVLQQSVANALESADSPERVDESLTRLLVTLEELEGRFSDYEGYVEALAERRQEITDAFEQRRFALLEERNRRADGMVRAAERLLKGIAAKAEAIDDDAGLRAYFAGDLMVAKLRDYVSRLQSQGDTVRADDLATRLAALRESSSRQLRDRRELYADGQNVIRFGRRTFNVNPQALDLTLVRRDDGYALHITGTNYFATLHDPEIDNARDLWEADSPAESPEVYRAEWLASQLQRVLGRPGWPDHDAVAAMDHAKRFALVREFMGPRFEEGYVKGVHDEDAARILGALLSLGDRLGPWLGTSSRDRVLAQLAWLDLADGTEKSRLSALARGCGDGVAAMAGSENGLLLTGDAAVVDAFAEMIGAFAARARGLFDTDTPLKAETEVEAEADAEKREMARRVKRAAHYLAGVTGMGVAHPVSGEAAAVLRRFRAEIERRGHDAALREALARVDESGGGAAEKLTVLRTWLRWSDAVMGEGAFLISPDLPAGENGDVNAILPDGARASDYIDEVAAMILSGNTAADGPVASVAVDGLRGEHPRIVGGTTILQYRDFRDRMERHALRFVPRFEALRRRKAAAVEEGRAVLKLDQYKPQSLAGFVRNKLVNNVYLPLIGDNLAKQIGEAGDAKRADRSGLLLMISPPGYGKTTLMEYVAARLGLAFMKINGPALGHRVLSLDPAEAPNATAREELGKLALALEMGDNAMIYVDDIQHCHPEFLQKFISLTDAQRRIEGVHNGRSKTYDLRGRKVAVVMAGNPYTESGAAFVIPDMLANRADTYNLGDILGGHEEAFRLSYLENALTANRTLAPLASRPQTDIVALIRAAESLAAGGGREGLELAEQYGADEIDDYLAVLRKLLRVRDTVLAVNQAYIASAAQADAHRREPPFKLQGSYRNMGRMAEKVLPLMNDAELETVIDSHYQNEAQTLAQNAEANLLKFKEIRGKLTEADAERWDEIKRAFLRDNSLRGADPEDRAAQMVATLGAVKESLDATTDHVRRGMGRLADAAEKAAATVAESAVTQAASTQASAADAADAREREDGHWNELVRVLSERPEAVAPDALAELRRAIESVGERLAEFAASRAEGLSVAMTAADAATPHHVALVPETLEALAAARAATATGAGAEAATTPATGGGAADAGEGMVPRATVEALAAALRASQAGQAAAKNAPRTIEVQVPNGMLRLLTHQIKLIELWMGQAMRTSLLDPDTSKTLLREFEETRASYQRLASQIQQRSEDSGLKI